MFVSISGLCSIPLIYMSILLPTPHYLHYSNFIISLPILLFLKTVLAILIPLPFHINLRINLSIITKYLAEFFYWIFIKSMGQLEKNDIFTILSLLVPEWHISVFASSLISFINVSAFQHRDPVYGFQITLKYLSLAAFINSTLSPVPPQLFSAST